MCVQYGEFSMNPLVTNELKQHLKEGNIDELSQRLRDPDTYRGIRALIAERLGQLADKAAVGPLIQTLHDEDVYIQRKAIHSLGHLGGSKAINPLLFILKHENFDSVCAAAVFALQKIAESTPKHRVKIMKHIVEALKHNTPLTRVQAARAIHRLGDSAALKILGTTLEWMLDEILQVLVKWHHISRAQRRFVRGFRGEWYIRGGRLRIEGHIMGKFRHEWISIEQVLKGIGEIGEPVVKPLVQKLRDDGILIRVFAATALGWTRDSEAVEALIQTLSDENRYVRISAAIALGRIGDPRAVEPLLHLLQDFSHFVRVAAIDDLEKLADERVIEPLDHAHTLQREQTWVYQTKIIQVLGALGDRRAVEPIINVLQRETHKSCWLSGIQALGKLGGTHAATFLTQILDRKGFEKAVARALGESRGWWTTKHLVHTKRQEKLVDRIEEAIPSLDESAVEVLDASGFTSREVMCPNCGQGIPLEATSCLVCNQPLHRCIVCFGIIELLEDSVRCPHCDQFAHRVHLLKWLELREICPHCHQHLHPKDISSPT